MINYEQVLMPNDQVFKRNLRSLSRKYRHIRSDVQPVIEQLKSGVINIPIDAIISERGIGC